MEHRQVRQNARPGWSVSPARVDAPGDWKDLLKTCAQRTEEMRAEHRGRAGLDETEEIVFALARAVEQRDAQTGGHCERLAFISVALGIALGLDRVSLLALYRGGYLHDVGKVGIPDSILFKPGKLTAEEWVTMRSHSVRGEEICRHLKSLSAVLPIIRHHHERWDGSGYPDGLRGDQIPLLARVLQIADIYDALTSARPYKPAYTPAEAIDIMRMETARSWRDPRIFHLFTRLQSEVISKLGDLGGTERSLPSMQQSLVSLQRSLVTESQALTHSDRQVA
ncbi:MAG TPA: HD domain-containing phosphohydrolase [Bryobacteraceae bacterium]